MQMEADRRGMTKAQLRAERKKKADELDGGVNSLKLHADRSGSTARRMRFVQEYVIDLNAKEAAIRAGYSEKSAPQIACQLLKKSDVAKAIDELMSKDPGITRARIVDELAWIAMLRASEATDAWPDGVKMSDKLNALDKLTRILGGYRDKVALTDPDGGPLQINIIKGLAE